MITDPYQNDKQSIKELLKHYDALRNGRNSIFLEEESFEKIIDYFDEQEEYTKALEAAETSIDYFPFSSSLLIRKADILLSSRKYYEALNTLDKAETFDGTNVNLYFLKTDAFLALDRQEKVVEVLEEAMVGFEGEEKIELLLELADV